MSWDDLDDGEWQDMPVIRSTDKQDTLGLDADDKKKYNFQTTIPVQKEPEDKPKEEPELLGNTAGIVTDRDAGGREWREKQHLAEEMDYTRLELDDDPEEDEISMRTQYLFNEDKGMTPLSQLQATKTLLSEGQRIAYVGLCKLVCREMIQTLALAAKGAKELEPARENCQIWANKIMGRLYRHMDVDSSEQRMIEQLEEHGVTAEDLVPSLATTHVVANPEYDPEYVPTPVEEKINPLIHSSTPQVELDYEHPSTPDPIDIPERLKQDQPESTPTQKPEKITNPEQEEHETESDSERLGKVAREVKRIERLSSTAEGKLEVLRKPRSTVSLRVSTASPEEAGDVSNALDSPITPNASTFSIKQSPVSVPLPPTPQEFERDISAEDMDQKDPLSSSESTLDDFNAPLPSSLPGVSTTLTAADKTITLDIRWTIICDLFLSLIADSVYDARSRVLLGKLAEKLGLAWNDVIRFERRLTEALEIQESVKNRENRDILESNITKAKQKRYVMMGLATLGGGLVIGLSAGLLAPVIGAGIGAALTTVGVGGTTSFLTGAGGAAIISTGATLSGSFIGGKAMFKRTRNITTFELLPVHNNKRVNCFITIPGFMKSSKEDVRLPFNPIDPVMGDVFSVLWEPEMLGDTGTVLKILRTEVLTQASQQILALTVMTALMSALQWPILLTKLGYLIDNPWHNALDRSRQAGLVLADILINRRMGVRPISLVGFSLGARMIFYALLELAKRKAFGIIQEVYLFGATVTGTTKQWREIRGIVSGRFVNAYAMNDWVLGYLFRATAGGMAAVAGLRPIEHVPEMDNVDITSLVDGHSAYRTKMPVLLEHVGLKTTTDHFDEPDDDEEELPEREIVTAEEEARRLAEKERKENRFRFFKKKKKIEPVASLDRTDSYESGGVDTIGRATRSMSSLSIQDPPRSSTDTATHEHERSSISESASASVPVTVKPPTPPELKVVPVGFDIQKLREQVAEGEEGNPKPTSPIPSRSPSPILAPPIIVPPTSRPISPIQRDPSPALSVGASSLNEPPSGIDYTIPQWPSTFPGLGPNPSPVPTWAPQEAGISFGDADGNITPLETPFTSPKNDLEDPNHMWGGMGNNVWGASSASLRPPNPW